MAQHRGPLDRTGLGCLDMGDRDAALGTPVLSCSSTVFPHVLCCLPQTDPHFLGFTSSWVCTPDNALLASAVSDWGKGMEKDPLSPLTACFSRIRTWDHSTQRWLLHVCLFWNFQSVHRNTFHNFSRKKAEIRKECFIYPVSTVEWWEAAVGGTRVGLRQPCRRWPLNSWPFFWLFISWNGHNTYLRGLLKGLNVRKVSDSTGLGTFETSSTRHRCLQSRGCCTCWGLLQPERHRGPAGGWQALWVPTSLSPGHTRTGSPGMWGSRSLAPAWEVERMPGLVIFIYFPRNQACKKIRVMLICFSLLFTRLTQGGCFLESWNDLLCLFRISQLHDLVCLLSSHVHLFKNSFSPSSMAFGHERWQQNRDLPCFQRMYLPQKVCLWAVPA